MTRIEYNRNIKSNRRKISKSSNSYNILMVLYIKEMSTFSEENCKIKKCN